MTPPKKSSQPELSVASTEPVELNDDKKSGTLDSTTRTEEDSETKAITTKDDDESNKEDVKVLQEEQEEEDKPPTLPPKPTAPVEDKVDEVPINDGVEDTSAPPPPPPPRPLSPVSQISKTLKEAFPTIEDKYITAVIIASQGNLDPAFNALLYLSDPSYKPQIDILPNTNTNINNTKSTTNAGISGKQGPDATLTDDELLARQLQKEFEKEDRRRRQKHQDRQHRRQQNSQNHQFNDDEESPDEFDQIKESFTQGIEEARTTLNGWVSGLSKKFQGNDESNQSSNKPQLFGALGGSSFRGNSQSNPSSINASRRTTTNKFDEDPEILSNNFHDRINLSNNDPEDTKETSSFLPNRQPSNQRLNSNEKKWQPLNSDVPINSDAFLVTDSEDEDTGVANYDKKGKN